MHELRVQAELKAFYQFASEQPTVWDSLKNHRLEHVKFGSGTVVEFVASPSKGCEPILSVRFDRPTWATTAKGLKYFLLPPLFEEGKLKYLSTPSDVVAPFRAFVEQARWKKDRRRFEEVLEEHRIKHLYHFTDSRNLGSISKHGGLYSWWRCKQMGIEVPAPGGNRSSQDMDCHNGLQDYVRLSFNHLHPMKHVARKEGRVKNIKTLAIDTSVIYLESTLFSNINANDREAWVGGDIESLQRVKFDIATGRWHGEIEKKLFQAEVLVKSHVPLDLIKNL